MKLFLAAAILLATINMADAQPELGAAANNPIITSALIPLFACQEAIIRDNFFLQRDEKNIWPLVSNGCATQIDKAQEACGLITDYDNDDCETIIDDLLRRNSTDIVNDIMKKNR